MNTNVAEMVENSIPELASDSIFFDDCCGRYYSVITGMSYCSYEDAKDDVSDLLTRNLDRLTR